MTVIAVSPGPTNTNFGGGGPLGPDGSADTGAQAHAAQADQVARGIVWAAVAREIVRTSGSFYMRFKRRALKGATDPVLARKVWAISDGQTGITSH